jgi:hypothetical protein
MRRVISVDGWTAALLAALGLAACGGKTTPTDAFPCNDPKPLVVGGVDTGFDTCQGGLMRRRKIVECPNLAPRSAPACSPNDGTCTADAECTDQPYGFCGDTSMLGCVCNYGCRTDADCGHGEICLCGDPVGTCVRATCTSDASCAKGFLCSSYEVDPICGGVGFSCQTPQDTCGSDPDCQTNECGSDDGGAHVCVQPNCHFGRPFLVEGAPHVAPIAPRNDWSDRSVTPRLDGLSLLERGALARHWTRVALMEHASVAAFARFALELLSLGAPPELVERTHAALADETRHARFAFALASAYAARAVGPGPLDVTGALDDSSPRAVFARLVREGCVGETVAALEAAEAREHAADPAVRAVLERIARDETRHAELAWRTLRWALEGADIALRDAAREALELGLGAAPPVAVELNAMDGAELLRHGVVSGAFAAELRRDAFERAVRPCALALLARAGRPRGSSAPGRAARVLD